MNIDFPAPDDENLALLQAAAAVREVVTALVVHETPDVADELIDEYLHEHGERLVVTLAMFIQFHTTHGAVPEVAENRFSYLLNRLGDLIEMAADVSGVSPEEVTLGVIAVLDEVRTELPDGERAFDAVRTCLVSHQLVRSGKVPWGIQKTLDVRDMLVLNEALAAMLVALTHLFDPPQRPQVVRVLAAEARTILAAQAAHAQVPVAELVEEYFVSLAERDAQLMH